MLRTERRTLLAVTLLLFKRFEVHICDFFGGETRRNRPNRREEIANFQTRLDMGVVTRTPTTRERKGPKYFVTSGFKGVGAKLRRFPQHSIRIKNGQM